MRQIMVLVVLIGIFWLSADASEGLPVSGTISTAGVRRSSFPDLAKVSPVNAVKSALSVKHGKLLKLELESEKGFLVYSIELVASEKEVVEIIVDAGSGDILRIERE